MRKFMTKLSCWGAVVCGMLMTGAQAGVVVEGTADGIAKPQKISYFAEKNRFTLDGGKIWRCPVPRDDLQEIVKALRLDDRLGVAAGARDETQIYGGMVRSSRLVAELQAADEFLRAMVYGDRARLRHAVLPQNYQPMQVLAPRRRGSLMYLRFDGFRYRLTDGVYQPDGRSVELMLIPLLAEPDAAGNPLPDYDALERGDVQPEDAGNVAHFTANQPEYLALPVLQSVVKIGETAAFVRLLRDGGFNLENMSRLLASGEDFSLESGASGITPFVETVVAQKTAPSADAAATALQADARAAESIKEILAADQRYGKQNAVNMSRASMNDGSYIKFRTAYLKNISAIDLSATPPDFQAAYAAHAAAWQKTLAWLSKQKIGDNPAALEKFKTAHAPYRDELNATYQKCRAVAGKYLN
ncbi:hypothetical protein FACS1894107_10010 [Planctomycetales bacterium]|nr:hypothetical protein FACS1894107_10010 [Planctomycetales bacterium]GHS96873.1 hypothetical protein FACS1894108_02280 [Planctomycetales bacterium]